MIALSLETIAQVTQGTLSTITQKPSQSINDQINFYR